MGNSLIYLKWIKKYLSVYYYFFFIFKLVLQSQSLVNAESTRLDALFYFKQKNVGTAAKTITTHVHPLNIGSFPQVTTLNRLNIKPYFEFVLKYLTWHIWQAFRDCLPPPRRAHARSSHKQPATYNLTHCESTRGAIQTCSFPFVPPVVANSEISWSLLSFVSSGEWS